MYARVVERVLVSEMRKMRKSKLEFAKRAPEIRETSKRNEEHSQNAPCIQHELATFVPKQAYELNELTELGHGSRSFLYIEIAEGRLRAVKRGRRTIVMAKDLEGWLKTLPAAEISPKNNAA
jgi:hypothetical protein